MREERSTRPGARTAALAVAAASALALPACWNGAFQTNVDKSKGGGARFELVIEARRSDVDASHFLVDQATGDVWALEALSSKRGRWVRLADGPADAADLEKRKEREDGEGEGA